MRILVANNHLQKTGGTENYTYALALQLKKMGHDVEYFTFAKGAVSDLLEQAGVGFMSRSEYDLILANHRTTVRHLQSYGFLIQTCHGTIPYLEQPSVFADAYVSITEEVKSHLRKKGFRSEIIYNGVDCERFRPLRPVSDRLSSVLSLCQSDQINRFIRECCEECGIEFHSSNKHTDNVWSIEEMINKADLVIGIGRSIYDAMACGRCVMSYDKRTYLNGEFGDGYLDEDNFDKALMYNCSGRGLRLTFPKAEFIEQMMKYNPEDASWAREKALELFDIKVSAEKYLKYYYSIDKGNAGLRRCRKVFCSGVVAVINFFRSIKHGLKRKR